jgi:hypothetical protein
MRARGLSRWLTVASSLGSLMKVNVNKASLHRARARDAEGGSTSASGTFKAIGAAWQAAGAQLFLDPFSRARCSCREPSEARPAAWAMELRCEASVCSTAR